MLRKIIQIDEKKCNGCGLCITACHEAAIELVDGKARLIDDKYCDGLGNCLPNCPTGAIEIIEREAVDFDEEAVKSLLEEKKLQESAPKAEVEEKMACGCPGMAARKLERKISMPQKVSKVEIKANEEENLSELRQWPVQLRLINTRAGYLQGADLLVAADCTAYAYANFHRDFIKDHITVIGCPKLDDNEFYKEKLAEIIANCNLKSITVVRMEVPCCGGIVNAVKSAMLKAQVIIPYKEVTIGTDGTLL
jgi:Pyruvate/2-oxoacid:ferredoxin oxidoreductase delta subunit